MTASRAMSACGLAVGTLLAVLPVPSPAHVSPRRITPVAARLALQADVLRRISVSGILAGAGVAAAAGMDVAVGARAAGAAAALRRTRRYRSELASIAILGLTEEARTSRDVMIYQLDGLIRRLVRLRRGGTSERPPYADLIREETTTDLTAAEICAIGVREVARLQGQLTRMARAAAFADLPAYRAALNADPANVPRNPEQLVDDVRRYVEVVRPRLGLLVRDPPATPLVVEVMPADSFPNITHHVDGSAADGSPGRILVAVSDWTSRTTLGDEAVALHEGLPGHELQVSIQQRAHGLPEFRRRLRYTAYSEGWAVYAEGLGTDLGLRETPSSAFGRVNLDLTRALRLVADTGMHARGWTREQVAAYLRASGAEDEPTVAAEADRIAAWPAQGLAYKIGQLKFVELRERARNALGGSFDVRDLHDVMLRGGNLPLPILEQRVGRWIAGRQAGELRRLAGSGRHGGRGTAGRRHPARA